MREVSATLKINRDKRLKNNVCKVLWAFWNILKDVSYYAWILKRKRRGIEEENMTKEIMDENSPNLEKDYFNDSRSSVNTREDQFKASFVKINCPQTYERKMS